LQALKDDAGALIEASRAGSTSRVRLLIRAGTDVQVYNNAALMEAIAGGHTKVVKLLIKAGADIHTGKGYTLRRAASDGYHDMVKLFIKLGVDVHTRDNYALRWAVIYGHTSIVKTLIEAGADVHAFKWTRPCQYPKTLALLIKAGANPLKIQLIPAVMELLSKEDKLRLKMRGIL